MKIKVPSATGAVLAWLKHFDTAVRNWLCNRYGHKFYVGASGHYVGLPQAHCWRCGACGPSWGRGYQEQHRVDPMGNWFD